MKAELDRTASESFKAYIENRWYNIKYMWVQYQLDTHFSPCNTTNRFESHNAKLQ